MDYLYDVIDYKVMKHKILYIFCNIEKLFMAVCCANLDSLFLYRSTLEKQYEFKTIWILAITDQMDFPSYP